MSKIVIDLYNSNTQLDESNIIKYILTSRIQFDKQ